MTSTKQVHRNFIFQTLFAQRRQTTTRSASFWNRHKSVMRRTYCLLGYLGCTTFPNKSRPFGPGQQTKCMLQTAALFRTHRIKRPLIHYLHLYVFQASPRQREMHPIPIGAGITAESQNVQSSQHFLCRRHRTQLLSVSLRRPDCFSPNGQSDKIQQATPSTIPTVASILARNKSQSYRLQTPMCGIYRRNPVLYLDGLELAPIQPIRLYPRTFRKSRPCQARHKILMKWQPSRKLKLLRDGSDNAQCPSR